MTAWLNGSDTDLHGMANSTTITQEVCLQFEGRKVQVPASLLVKDGRGFQYVKLAASNFQINKLICGSSKEKNPAITNGKNLATLKQMRNEKLGIDGQDDALPTGDEAHEDDSGSARPANS